MRRGDRRHFNARVVLKCDRLFGTAELAIIRWAYGAMVNLLEKRHYMGQSLDSY